MYSVKFFLLYIQINLLERLSSTLRSVCSRWSVREGMVLHCSESINNFRFTMTKKTKNNYYIPESTTVNDFSQIPSSTTLSGVLGAAGVDIAAKQH